MAAHVDEMNSPVIGEFQNENRFLSNFWPVPGGVTVRGMTAMTTEHIYQAAKTVDRYERSRILQASTPGEAKRFGAELTPRQGWETLKLGLMSNLQAAKYANHELAQLLIATGYAALVEGNTWCDTFWGVCYCPKHNGEGTNWLGKILMVRRSIIQL